MAAAPFYDWRPVAPRVPCPRCSGRVAVSRCRTARELCGHCGHEWAQGLLIERAEVH
ncbi:hypothetical protein [Streptomyces sp. cg36]|uniref:hypothetical protein n=1 Tax=Streptomyces sp. cg36 TaxID=3238798 RepID=UPI0034E21C6B